MKRELKTLNKTITLLSKVHQSLLYPGLAMDESDQRRQATFYGEDIADGLKKINRSLKLMNLEADEFEE